VKMDGERRSSRLLRERAHLVGLADVQTGKSAEHVVPAHPERAVVGVRMIQLFAQRRRPLHRPGAKRSFPFHLPPRCGGCGQRRAPHTQARDTPHGAGNLWRRRPHTVGLTRRSFSSMQRPSLPCQALPHIRDTTHGSENRTTKPRVRVRFSVRAQVGPLGQLLCGQAMDA
jgi:hypothetical protein